MSKRKRDVTFFKPEEPAFLARLKAQAGYKEGPTIDTKREELSFDDDSDDHNDEEPQVVVVNDGDLTAEQASKLKLEKEEGPADLSQRVVFRKPEKTEKPTGDLSAVENSGSSATKRSKKDSRKGNLRECSKIKDSKSITRAVLSFNEDEDSEDS